LETSNKKQSETHKEIRAQIGVSVLELKVYFKDWGENVLQGQGRKCTSRTGAKMYFKDWGENVLQGLGRKCTVLETTRSNRRVETFLVLYPIYCTLHIPVPIILGNRIISRYFVVLKYFLVPSKFGEGGANALCAASPPPKL
jgi:hypothetical protein